MAIPTFQEFMFPILKASQGLNEFSLSDLTPILATELNLTDQDLRELLPSGKQTTFSNRVAWARFYMTKARLLESPSRGKHRITQRGRDLLSSKPSSLGIAQLSNYPEFLEFYKLNQSSPQKTNNEDSDINGSSKLTPEEILENSYQTLRKQLAQSLLEQIVESSPEFFENLVIELLVAMGYGGSRKDAGEAIGRSGDGGIDGIIKEDRLGLDIVYLQAKKWALDRSVPSSEVRDFTGSLDAHGAVKGVFLTTARFTRDAMDFVKRVQQKKIVLIDGEKLAQLMIDFDVGVSNVATYTIKRLDPDYFDTQI